MLRNFAAVLLPFIALAKGDDSGQDADNSTTLVLVDSVVGDESFKLTLNHFNTYDFDEEMYIFNGSLELQTNYSPAKFFEVGFCMQMDASDDQKWDCYTNRFEVDAAED